MLVNSAETMIADAMERSAQFASQAAEEHMRAFIAQMRELFGIEKIVLKEPYLPFLLVQAELRYLRRLAKLDARLQATKSYAVYAWNELEYKAEDAETSDVDVASAIEAETNRASIEAKQDLDAARQQAFGITQYQWHGGSCSTCAPYDGQICSWGEGMEPGDVHPNCQCSASPVADGAGEARPPQISGSDIADMALLLASLIPAVRAGRIGIAAVRGLGAVGRRVLGRIRRTSKKPTLRRQYEEEVKGLEKLERTMRREGKSNEQIARELSKQRRGIGERYKDLTPQEIRDRIYQRNIDKYGDKLGPSVDDLRNQGRTWEEIIESSKRPGGRDLF